MNHIRIYSFFVIFIMEIFSIPAFSQSEKIDVEIHIADKEAYIYLDSSTSSIGHGRTLYNIQLTQGKHTVTATRPSYTRVSKTVTISKSNYASRIIKLSSPQPIYGHLFVDSKPSRLEIYLDGVRTNQFTPYTFDSILTGTHSISLAYTGYKDYKRTVNVLDSDTVGVYAVLEENKALKPKEEHTTTYSGYNSGYSSNSMRSSSNNTYSSSYSSSDYSSYRSSSYKAKNKHDFHVYYWGFGTGLLLNWAFHTSFFDFRYKWIEIRPCLWGINLPLMQNISHTKLPPAYVDQTSKNTDYWGKVEYSMYVPERGVQIFYTPMLRFHIPIKGTKAIILGAGPQVSWTEFSWKGRTQSLSNVSDYVFYDKYSSTSDRSYGLKKDELWFTAEVAFLWNFDWGSDIDIYARYQDGFYIGFEYRIGREY